MTIREATPADLLMILSLYLDLHETDIPAADERLWRTWDSILSDENHHLIVCEEDEKIVSSCVCVVVPNLTRNVRPYALIENVVTAREYRGRGCATACLAFAREIARRNDCYKLMLMTGAKDERTLAFYRRAGYNDVDKTAFVQWL